MKRNIREFETRGQLNIKHAIIMIAAVLLLLFGVAAFISVYFQVTSVTVEGAEHYTEEEIQDIVMSGTYGRNSLYLFLKYRNRKVSGVPFVETMDIDILSPNEIKITVYEKAIAGYVEYLGRCMYFDRDGVVVESTLKPAEGIPCVAGMDFEYVILHEKLPVEDEEIFRLILYITQLMTKYDIRSDRIYFNKNYEITLYFGDARVFLGTDAEIDSKMDELKNILPDLAGMEGTLHMENYSEENNYITFKGKNVEKN